LKQLKQDITDSKLEALAEEAIALRQAIVEKFHHFTLKTIAVNCQAIS
jgi:hypothetical protein